MADKSKTIVLFILLLAGCGSPQVSFAPKIEPEGIAFHIALQNANGFLRMMLWEKDTRKTLWDINLNYYSGPVLKYGEVPARFTTYNGGRNSAKQNYPKIVVPRPIPVGKDILVYLDYQYDGFFEASASVRGMERELGC